MEETLPIAPSAPPSLVTPAGFAYGRFREPIAEPRLPPSLFGRFRTKEWHYHSIVTDDWFLGVALVGLGYAANAFLYFVERRAPDRRLEYEAISPLARALEFAPSSIRGRSQWQKGLDHVSIEYREGWRLELDVGLSEGRLEGDLQISPDASLALSFELGRARPAYTHKAAALLARGELSLGARSFSCEGALATLDWTRSLARRHTHWKWASFAGRSRDGRRIGLNLSAEVYDDPPGVSHENAAFVDGETHALGGVTFQLPKDPAREPWRIRSSNGAEVDLEFQPLGARAQKLNLGLVKSDFVQPYGLFQGKLAPQGVEPADVSGAFGVVEDHDAVW